MLTGKIEDNKNKAIFNVLKNNFIYKNKEQYYIFEDKYELIGFFVCNTDKIYEKKKKKMKELDKVEDDYNYYIYDTQWNEINDMDNGLLIKNNIVRNYKKKNTSIFNTSKVWGFSFKLENHKHVFKIVNKKFGINNLPGKIIENIAQRNTIKKIISDDF